MSSVPTYVRSALRVVVAQICCNMGWHVVQTTPMELLVDILHRYLEELGRTTHRYSEQFGRTEPNLDDVGLAFKDIGIPLGELEDFVNNVEPLPFVHDVAKFPLDRANNLKFPKAGSRKVQQRPEWIDEHLPLMDPDDDDEDESPSTAMIADGFGHKSCLDNVLGVDGMSQGLKRPLEIGSACGTFKRSRLFADDEGCPMREGISVFMTLTGEISPVCEGRVPEARAPTFYDEERQTSPPYSGADLADQIGAPRKDVKKELKKDDKKAKDKNKKDKGKLLKKKTGKKDKDKMIKDGSKKVKDKDKTKSSKVKKLKVVPSVKLTNVERGPDGKFKKMKSSKLKLSKSQHGSLKQFVSKSKIKGDKSIVSSKANKVKKKLKKLQQLPMQLLISPKFPKTPKLPKTAKSPVQHKAPRPEKHSSPLAQLASFLNNAANQKNPIDSRSSPENNEIHSVHSEPSDGISGVDSPKSLIIDDNPETVEKQELEFRMAALNESIDAAIQRGLEESEKQHQESSRMYHDTIEDVIRQGIEASVKTEPRDVYDFTDDETSPPTTPATPSVGEVPSSVAVAAAPSKKKQRRDSAEVGKKVRDKIKEKIKQKSKDSKPKMKAASSNLKPEIVDFADERPKTPEVHHHHPPIPEQEPCVSFQAPFPRMLGQFPHPHLPYFGQISHVPPALLPYPSPAIPPLPLPFQSHTPPNMPMPPVGFYVRNPRPDAGNLRINDPLTNPNVHLLPPTLPTNIVGSSHPQEKDEDLPKVKTECVEEIEKPKPKEHKREKKEKSKDKESGENEGEKDPEKVKPKKKKEKGKDKKKSSDGDGDKGQTKSSKTTNKPVKAKEKGKEKKSEKEKKKKEEKVKEDSNNSGIPRITLKLGGNAATTEGTKIVIKPLTTRESTQSSDSSSPVNDVVSTPKPHPKPQSKVNPVPLPARPPAPAVPVTCTASTPARTVITETVGTIIDDQGNKIWICPACTRPDDGSPMIGCDECDDWYHWVCVGIVVPPKEEENWFCNRCIAKKQCTQKKKKKKHRSKDKMGAMN